MLSTQEKLWSYPGGVNGWYLFLSQACLIFITVHPIATSTVGLNLVEYRGFYFRWEKPLRRSGSLLAPASAWRPQSSGALDARVGCGW